MRHEEKEILKRLLRESKENAEEIARVLHIVREIERELRPQPQPLTRSIAVQFTGEPPMPNNALTLNVGQTSQASIQPLLADGITPSGGTLSAVSYSFADPSATVVLNAEIPSLVQIIRALGMTPNMNGFQDFTASIPNMNPYQQPQYQQPQVAPVQDNNPIDPALYATNANPVPGLAPAVANAPLVTDKPMGGAIDLDFTPVEDEGPPLPRMGVGWV